MKQVITHSMKQQTLIQPSSVVRCHSWKVPGQCQVKYSAFLFFCQFCCAFQLTYKCYVNTDTKMCNNVIYHKILNTWLFKIVNCHWSVPHSSSPICPDNDHSHIRQFSQLLGLDCLLFIPQLSVSQSWSLAPQNVSLYRIPDSISGHQLVIGNSVVLTGSVELHTPLCSLIGVWHCNNTRASKIN